MEIREDNHEILMVIIFQLYINYEKKIEDYDNENILCTMVYIGGGDITEKHFNTVSYRHVSVAYQNEGSQKMSST